MLYHHCPCSSFTLFDIFTFLSSVLFLDNWENPRTLPASSEKTVVFTTVKRSLYTLLLQFVFELWWLVPKLQFALMADWPARKTPEKTHLHNEWKLGTWKDWGNRINNASNPLCPTLLHIETASMTDLSSSKSISPLRRNGEALTQLPIQLRKVFLSYQLIIDYFSSHPDKGPGD